MFVTVLYAELNETSGLVTFVNAGHCELFRTKRCSDHESIGMSLVLSNYTARQ